MYSHKGFNSFISPAPSVSGVSSTSRSIRERNSHRPAQSQDTPITGSLLVDEDPELTRRRFKSSRLIGLYEKPWIGDHSYKSRETFDKIILGVCTLIGCAIAAVLCWNAWNQLPQHDYCLVLDDNFAALDTATWSHELGIGGFNFGSFEWTTNDPANSYVSSNGLHIVPTMTVGSTNITIDELMNGYTLNLTSDGSCYSTDPVQCSRTSNSSAGTIINPVRSARLTTAQKVSIKYGRVEIVAKMPKGDWLFPSIWMEPENQTYGAWPQSGEINIAQVRGNSHVTYESGRDTVASAMHWGAAFGLDQVVRTSGKVLLRRQDLGEGFHTYGIEWSEDYMFTWVDNRVVQMMYIGFGSSWGGNMFERGLFQNMWINGSAVPNVWSQTGNYNTPFDQPFHLVLNVAVGGSSGFFPNSKGNKPWIDGSSTAMRDFWKANSTWLPTWGANENRGMTVKSVKMWQEGKC